MNMVTAFAILCVLALIGLPGLGAQFEPHFLHPTYAQAPALFLEEVVAGSPAAKAGLVRGDYVTTANGTPMTDDAMLRNFTKDHAGRDVTLHVRSKTGERDVTVKLNSSVSKVGFLGVGTQAVYKLRYSPGEAVVAAGYITGALFVATIVGVLGLLIHIPALILGLFAKSIPAAAATASGPVGIIYILQSLTSIGYSYIFLFMANIAVALAAFNVLPLPALDGGRLAIITIQKVTKRRIDADTEAKIHAFGFMALIGLMLVITVYDVRKIFFHV